MSLDDLRCNSLDCRSLLSGACVVTTCSHCFCLDCSNILFRPPTMICPACETALPDSDDVVQASLNPSNAYKTSVLSGLHPSVIFDICSRAVNFYSYQISQEALFQSLSAKRNQERIAVLEAQCQNIIREATSEIHCPSIHSIYFVAHFDQIEGEELTALYTQVLKERVKVAERDLELERRKVRDLHETHKQNAKAYSKLKAQCDKLQQRALLGPSAKNNVNMSLNDAQPPNTNNLPSNLSLNLRAGLTSPRQPLDPTAAGWNHGGGGPAQKTATGSTARRSLNPPSNSQGQQQQQQQNAFHNPHPSSSGLFGNHAVPGGGGGVNDIMSDAASSVGRSGLSSATKTKGGGERTRMRRPSSSTGAGGGLFGDPLTAGRTTGTGGFRPSFSAGR